jgi:hypothetical protein
VFDAARERVDADVVVLLLDGGVESFRLVVSLECD